MTFADAVFLIALAQPADALHGRAKRWASSLLAPCLVTEYVMLEVFSRLSVPPNRAKAHKLLSFIRNSGKFVWLDASPEWFARGIARHERAKDKEWSLVDCISFEVMTDQSLTQALTFDHHFEQAGFEALLRREPPSFNGTSAP